MSIHCQVTGYSRMTLIGHVRPLTLSAAPFPIPARQTGRAGFRRVGERQPQCFPVAAGNPSEAVSRAGAETASIPKMTTAFPAFMSLVRVTLGLLQSCQVRSVQAGVA